MALLFVSLTFWLLHSLALSQILADRQISIVLPGIFGFDATASLSYNGPAVNTAITSLRRKYPQYNWKFDYVADEEVSSCVALLENVQDLLSRWYYTQRDQEGLSLLVTPGCIEGVYLNQFAAAWDILLVTSSAADDLIKDRQFSPTWVTTTPFPPPNEVYCSFLAALNWTDVYICLDRNDPTEYYGYAFGRVTRRLTACGINFIQSNFSSSNHSFSTRPILQEFNSKSRIFLYFGQPLGLRLILKEAVRLNITSGEHVYVVALPWTSRAFGNFTWQNFKEDDEIVRQAYQSVIILNLIDDVFFASQNVRNLTPEWQRLSKNIYNNTQLQFELPLPNLVATQAAIEMTGMVVDEIFRQGGKTNEIPSGTILANMLMNRSFDSQVGRTDMTAFGHGSYRVHASYFDQETNSFKVFLKSSLTGSDQFIWNRVAQLRWFNGTVLPPDVPRCGFDGSREICADLATQRDKLNWILASTLGAVALAICFSAAFIWFHYNVRVTSEDWWQLDDVELIPFDWIFKRSCAPKSLMDSYGINFKW